MKVNILFLSSLLIALSASHTFASDCIDDACDTDNDDMIISNETVITGCPGCTLETQTFNPNDDAELARFYDETMAAAAETRARIEALLASGESDTNTWIEHTQTCIAEPEPELRELDWGIPGQVRTTFETDGCPFETMAECKIWRRKPIMREIVAPRSPRIRYEKMDNILAEIDYNGELDANSPTAIPLMNRYHLLMKSARACCTEGITYSLRNAGASDGLVYKFLVDDANFYNVGDRCLMMTDSEIGSGTYMDATSDMISDVRRGCLCRSRNWYTSLLQPFIDAWRISPTFAESPFYWTYTDGVGRAVTVSINNDVQNVLDTLATCP